MHELDIAAAFRGSMLEWAARRARAHDRVWKERAMEQTCMLTKLLLAAGLVLAAATLAPAASAAAPQSPIPAVFAADGGLIQKAQWGWGYGRCHAWRRECAARWGWRTPGFFRCLARHGC